MNDKTIKQIDKLILKKIENIKNKYNVDSVAPVLLNENGREFPDDQKYMKYRGKYGNVILFLWKGNDLKKVIAPDKIIEKVAKEMNDNEIDVEINDIYQELEEMLN